MIPDKFDRNENPDWEPDALVEVIFTSREAPVRNGCRPQYKVSDDYLTTTHHWFIENGQAFPNMPTLAFVKFITPEAYPNCLVSGQLIEVCAGAKPIGSATVIEVYNVQLQKRT